SATGDGVPGGARILPLASVLVLVALAHSDSNLLDAARALLVIRRELRCGACVADDGNSCPGDVTGVLVNTHLSLSFSQLPSGALSSVPDSTGSIQIGRSEERRVGKEGRCRWSTGRYRRKCG